MLLIKGALLKTIVSGDIENGEVLVDAGKIVAVGRDLPVPEGTEIYDASGCLVTPGLIDAHTHLGSWEASLRWEGADLNERSSPVTADLSIVDGINPRDPMFEDTLHAGITSVCVAPGSANVLGGTCCAMKTLGTNISKMLIKNPVAMKCAFGENPKNCYGQQGKAPVTRMKTAALLRQELIKAVRYGEEIEAAKADSTKKMPYDPSLEALLPVLRKELPLKVHAHRADDILTALRIIQEFGLKATLDHVTEGHFIVDELLEAGLPVLVGPSLTGSSKPELQNKSFKTPGILANAGLKVSIITDSMVIPCEYLPLCAGLAIKAGMKEEDAWAAVTINPATALGIEARVGSLEAGKDADIVVFDGNPLRDIQCRPRTVFVSCAGTLTRIEHR